MDLNLDEADIQWKFLIGCLIRRELEKDTIDRLSMSLFNMNLLDFAVESQNYPLCKVIQIHTAWIWIWLTKKQGATSDNGFIFKKINEN